MEKPKFEIVGVRGRVLDDHTAEDRKKPYELGVKLGVGVVWQPVTAEYLKLTIASAEISDHGLLIVEVEIV